MIIIIIKVKVILKRMKYRGVFRTQSNITIERLLVIYYFSKKVPFVGVLNTPGF